MSRCRLMVLAVVLFGCLPAVSGQPLDDGMASPYFDCPYVNYFDTDCPQLREQRQRPPLQGRQATPEPQPGPGRPDEPADEEDREDTQPGVLPDELILFPRQSLAPDAPPLFRLLLAHPTWKTRGATCAGTRAGRRNSRSCRRSSGRPGRNWKGIPARWRRVRASGDGRA